MFQAFYTTKRTGIGMGLSVSRSIIEGHDGRLWATPNDGHGATFAFSIPHSADSETGAVASDIVRPDGHADPGHAMERS
jgi:signal transduction histidine kinase